jgi:hypothetical protein
MGWHPRMDDHKASPAAGWNPGANLQRAQRSAAIDLPRIKLETYAPRRVLAFTGNWIRPFQEGLGVVLSEHAGLVEGLGSNGHIA